VAETVRQLTARGVLVIVVGPPPEFERPLPSVLARGWSNPAAAASAQLLAAPFQADAALKSQFADLPGVVYVSLLDTLCPKRQCVLSVDGAPLLFDQHHFTIAGARYVTSRALAAPLERALVTAGRGSAAS
jgi:hypothetical protein